MKNILKNKSIILFLFILVFINIATVNAEEIILNPNDSTGIKDALSTINGGSDSNNTIILNPGNYNKTNDRNNEINRSNMNLTIMGNGSSGSVMIDAQKTLEICFMSVLELIVTFHL